MILSLSLKTDILRNSLALQGNKSGSETKKLFMTFKHIVFEPGKLS